MTASKITGFHTDDEGHYVAELSCGHQQHMRHDPPWQNRAWVLTAVGRERFIGTDVPCRQCEEGRAAPEKSFKEKTIER